MKGVCRVCGCTNEKSCLARTGRRCRWEEDDLCSECIGQTKPISQSILNLNNDMNFFEQLEQVLGGVKQVTIVASKKGDRMHLMVLPEFSNEGVQEKTRPLLL